MESANDMGHAIVTFDMTGQLLMEPQIEFSCFWNTRWIGNENSNADHDALDKDGNMNPTGVALKIWNSFLGTQMVRSESCDSVITYSSINRDRNKLFVYAVNKRGCITKVKFEIKPYEQVPSCKCGNISELLQKIAHRFGKRSRMWMKNALN